MFSYIKNIDAILKTGHSYITCYIRNFTIQRQILKKKHRLMKIHKK